MKRLLLGLLLLMLCAVAAAWLAWPALTNWARVRLEKLVAEAVERPVRVDQLSLSLYPLRVRVQGLAIGAGPTLIGEADSLEVRLWALASLTELRPVISARIAALSLDLRRLPEPKAGRAERKPGGGGIPSLRVKELEIDRAKVRLLLEDVDSTLTVARAVGELDGRSRTRRLNVGFEITTIQLERAGRQLNLAEIRVAGGASRKGLFVETATIVGAGIDVSLTPTPLSVHEYTLLAAVDFDRVSSFLQQSIRGAVKIDGKVSGNLANPDLTAQLTIINLVVDRRALGDVSAHVSRTGEGVRVADLDMTGPLGELTGSAEVTTSGTVPVNGTLNLQRVDLDSVLSALGRSEEIGNEVGGTVSISGTLKPLDVNLSATGGFWKAGEAAAPGAAWQLEPARPPNAQPARGEQAGQRIAAFDLHAHIESGGATMQLELQQPEQGNRLSAELSSKDEQLTGPVRLQVRDLAALSQLLPKSVRDLGLTGQVEGAVNVSGATVQPKIQASVAGKELSLRGVTVPRLAGDFVIEDDVLRTPRFTLETATGGVELSGAVALGATAQNDWRLEIRSLESDLVVGIIHAFTRSTPPVSGGKLNGTVQARGPWARAAVDASLAAQSVYLEREPIERIEIGVNTELPRWTGHASLVHTTNEVLTIDGSGTGTSRLQVTINSTPFQLANFRGAGRRALAGAVMVRGDISGKLEEPEGMLNVTASNVSLDGRQLGDFVVRATGRQGEWVATATAFQNALDVNATLRTASDYPYTLDVRFRGLQFGRLISTDQSLQAVVTGDIDLKGSLKTLASPSGTVRINELDVSRDQYRVTAAEPIRIDVTEGRLFLRSMILAAPSSRLNISGELATSGDVDIQAQGEGNLVLLELIGPPFSSARGQVGVAVQIQRHPESGWNLRGQGQLRDTALDIGLPVAFTDMNGNFRLAGSSVRIDNLDGKAGGGQFHIDGAVSLDQGPKLSWNILEVSVSTSQGIEAQVSGAGEVRGTWKAIAVNGDVEIINALYDKNIELTDFLPFFREQIRPAPQTKPPAVEVRLNLHIHAPGGLYIDNNVAKVELGADLRLDGSADKPQLTGTVDFLTGEVKFRQRTFIITGGAIDFRDRGDINPIMNISAESQISTAEADYTVTVAVTGPADNLRIQLSADDPTLTETDILSLITLGQTAAQLQRQGGGISAMDAVALLPTGTITSPIANLIGVNRLEIEAVQSPIAGSAGSIEPRVSIGKDLTDRLRASLSTTFGVGTERMAQLEYRITRRISLLGSWEGATAQQSGAFGGDIKFRYEFRRLPFSLFPGGLETTADQDAQ